MLCVSPTPSGRCSNEQLPGSKHCSSHRPQARRVYNKYKRAHNKALSRNHDNMLKCEDTKLLLRYYSELYASHTGRTQHIEEFFSEDERDRGHMLVIEDLASKLSEVERRLCTLYEKSSTSTTEECFDSSSDDSDPDEQCDYVEDSELPEQIDGEITPAPECYNPDIIAIKLMYDRMIQIVSDRICKEGPGFSSENPCHIGFLHCVVVLLNKCEALGYLSGSDRMSSNDYIQDPQNVISPSSHVCALGHTKTAYRLMLMDWANVMYICSTFAYWFSVCGTNALYFQYKFMSYNPSGPIAVVPYFPLTRNVVSRLLKLSKTVQDVLGREKHDIPPMAIAVHPAVYSFSKSLGLCQHSILISKAEDGMISSTAM